MNQLLRKNKLIPLTIESYTSQGMGVGRYEGFAVFVAGAAIGDIITAHVLRVEKSFAYAKIADFLTNSPDRCDPGCVSAIPCGGCSYQHITYEKELEAKRTMVSDAMQRIGKLTVNVLPVVGGEPTHYRNKAQYPIGRDTSGNVVTGFFAAGSHRIIPQPDCALQPIEFASIVKSMADFAEQHDISTYDEVTSSGILRHIYLRKGQNTGEIMVCAVINATTLPQSEDFVSMLTEKYPQIVSILLNINQKETNVILGDENVLLYGKGSITEKLLGKEFIISPLSFFQVNTKQAERLYTIAAELANIQANETVLDLYCGTGSIGLSIAGNAKQLTGIDIVPQAIEDARKNAKANHVANSNFFCADLHDEAVIKGLRNPDLLIIDPPRKGCNPKAILSALKPRKIVYISCDPATLARDLAVFAANGYAIGDIHPVDMFPRTSHVECVVLLQQVEV